MGPLQRAELVANLAQVRARIEAAAGLAGRDPAQIKLLAVTKGQPAQVVRMAVDCGLRAFGENRVKEGVDKRQAVSDLRGLEWHMIGHIQSRKAARAVNGFDMLQSVDSLGLALKLDRAAEEAGKKIPVLLECNVSGEVSKSGWAMARETEWESRLPELYQAAHLSHLAVRGLMTMAPQGADPVSAKGVFDRLGHLRDYLSERIPDQEWPELSMGMSDDFEPAIRAGATIVRLGRAIFGERLAELDPPTG
jgi:PLP dependent protein